MKKLIILIISFFLWGIAESKDKNHVLYPTADIPPELKKDAYAVCRDYHHEFELINYGQAIEKVHMAITVLEENGDDFTRLVIPYDKTSKIKSITGKSYNQSGIQDDKLKSSDIQDVNYTSAGAIYDDLRLKLVKFKPDTYPYTIEYDYEIEHSGLIDYPEWDPLEDYRLSVEKSSLKIIWPENLKIRIKEVNLPDGCKTETTSDGKHIAEWEVDSLPAWKEEPLSPDLITQLPHVICAPTTFEYDGSTGSMNTWEELGHWQAELNQGPDQLPEPRKAEIKSIAGDVKDTLSAIRAVYEYMQKRTRYVGIQLGLGGYKPFPAETVDRLGYGDCKALSNYMKVLLNCIGISSCFTLVGAGSNEGITMKDFPTIGQNNHAILCVPLKNDTIWLECTSQTAPCGYLGTFVRGRTALLITGDGGKLVKTPQLKAEENQQIRTANVQITPDGAMQASVKTRFTGYQYDNVSDQFTESQEDQKKNLLKNFGITGLIINSFSYDIQKSVIPEATETIEMQSLQYATKTGTRLFIPLNMLNRRRSIPAKVENRRLPVEQKYAYFDKDSIVFRLPSEYMVETTPKDKRIDTGFGTYQTSVTVANGIATYVREVKIPYGKWPKEKYDSLVDFYSGIVNADKAKLVLKQKAED